MFLSRNYRLIVDLRKFDVLKTNMLDLRTSNFQGATIRPIVPRQNTLLSLLFSTKFSPGRQFNFFWWKPWKPNVKFEKENRQNPLNAISIVCFLQTACLQTNFHGRTLSIRAFSADGHYPCIFRFSDSCPAEIWCMALVKTNICPRSEASRTSMLVLRASNFQGATIRPIVPRHKNSIVFIVHH